MPVLGGHSSRFDNLISTLDAQGDDHSKFTIAFWMFFSYRRIIVQQCASKPQLSSLKGQNWLLKSNGEPNYDIFNHYPKPGHRDSCFWEQFPELRRRHRKHTKILYGALPGTVDTKPGTVAIGLTAQCERRNMQIMTNSCLVDFGCSSHITFCKSLFTSYKSLNCEEVKIGDGSSQNISGIWWCVYLRLHRRQYLEMWIERYSPCTQS